MSATRSLISYRALEFGGDAVIVSLIGAAFAVVPLLIALAVGRIVDRGHLVTTVHLGNLMVAVGVVIALISTGMPMLIVSSTLLGLGQLLSALSAQTAVSLWSERSRIDAYFG